MMIRFNHHLLGWFLQEFIGINTTFIGVLGGRMPWEIRLFWWLKPLQSLDYLGSLGWLEFTGNLYKNMEKTHGFLLQRVPRKPIHWETTCPGFTHRTIRGDPAVRSSLNRARREHRPGARRVTVWDWGSGFFRFFWNGFSHPSIHRFLLIFCDLI